MEKTLLFITLSNIGDSIMTTPVLEYIHKKNPDFRVDIVCDQKSRQVFEHCSYLNNIFIKDKKSGLLGILRLIFQLRKKKYKIAIDLRTDFILYLIRAEKKFYKVNDSNIHSVKKHFLSICNNYDELGNPTIWIPKEIEKTIQKKYFLQQKKILILGVGANSKHKIWPIENFVILSKLIKDKFNLIYLVGDSRDRNLANYFCKFSEIKSVNLCGRLSLIESAAVIKFADFFIGNDSGLGHIASAVETPSYTIFGKESPERYHPWSERAYWFKDINGEIKSILPNQILQSVLKAIN